MDSDDDLIMISAIEHYSYCPRQCALIHIEQVYDENVFTLRGNAAHERADTVSWESAPGAVIERALPVWSDRLGLNGRADIVEFRNDGSIYPVEYKHGPRKQKAHDDLQLCAQAMCLEEMEQRPVERGAIYHHSSRRRREVEFTPTLRNHMEQTVDEIRRLFDTGEMPPPPNDARCPNCSLNEACMPAVALNRRYAKLAPRLYRVDDDGEDAT